MLTTSDLFESSTTTGLSATTKGSIYDWNLKGLERSIAGRSLSLSISGTCVCVCLHMLQPKTLEATRTLRAQATGDIGHQVWLHTLSVATHILSQRSVAQHASSRTWTPNPPDLKQTPTHTCRAGTRLFLLLLCAIQIRPLKDLCVGRVGPTSANTNLS